MKARNLNTPEENFRFRIPGYGLDHQDGAIVDIVVNLDFKDDVGASDPFAYPEFVSVANFIKNYLVNYPNETDFWEIVNKNLVTALLTKTIPTNFGVEYNLDQVVDSLTVDFDVSQGSSLVGFPRSSEVTGSPKRKGIDFDQSFSFEIPGYGLDHQDGAIVDIAVDLHFKEDIGLDNPFEYPEFVSIVNFIKNYLVTYPNETDFWEIVNKNLVTALLTEKIPTDFGVEYNLDQVVDSLTVDFDVSQGSSLVGLPRSSTVTGSPKRNGIDFDQSFSFAIPGYGLDHQGGAIVDIAVDLNFKEDIGLKSPFEYPEFVSIANFIKGYLTTYPNETDFWEIVNKNLVTALLTERIPTDFGVEYNLDQVVDSLTVDFDVSQGSSLVGFPRSSEVTGSPKRNGIDFDQSFSFVIPGYGLDHQGGAIVDILVDMDFKENIGAKNPFDYPEFVSIVNFIKDYLVNYPNETDFWEILNKNLTSALLSDTIPTDFGVEYHLREVVDSLNVKIQVQSGSSLVDLPRASTVRQKVSEDARISLSLSPASVQEDGKADLIYTFRRTGPAQTPLTVNYSVSGSATPGSDYTGLTGSTGAITFAAGAATARLRLEPSTDASKERNETVRLTLASGTGYTIITSEAVSGTIVNDDVASATTKTLKPEQSSLLLLGDKRINGIGNERANAITGNNNNNTLIGLLGPDSLTGGGSADSDRFAYNSLAESLLGGGKAFDRITDFTSADRIAAPLSVQTERLDSSVGNTDSLSAASLSGLLTTTVLPAHAVAAFTATGQAGTFIAMNDGRPGFQSDSDALVLLANHVISQENFIDFA